ncbi:MAG: DUF2059 domain-containing protein [Hyphomicrobium sp.]|jgi:hypothetical protein|nr:DUF2059 domain-containing protein [Hyphomicrobium sp.]
MRSPRARLAGFLVAPVALVAAFTAGYGLADAKAPPDASLAAAQELIAATGASKQFEAVVPLMVKQLEPILIQMVPGKESEIKEIMALMVERFSERRSEMLDIIAKIYAAKLSEAEMKDLSAFFSKGAGAAFIAKQPEIVTESMAAGQQWGEKIGVEIEQQIRQELEKRGIKI